MPNPPLCSLAKFAFLGERVQHEVASGGTLYYKTNVRAGRSYALFVWAPEQSADLSLDLFSERTCTTPAAEATTLEFEPSVSGAVLFRVGTQASIVPTVSGELFIRVRHTSPLAPLIVNTLVIESTLFSPWWFTGGTNQAFIEIRNNMANPSSRAEVTLYRSNGTVCGTTDLIIPGNGNAAIAVNTIGDCAAAVSGSAQIAFFGTPGGMAANITTIDAVNGTSLNSPFTPRMTWSMFSR